MKRILVVAGVFVAPLVLAPRFASGAADPAAEKLFKTKCAPCHGDNGNGKTKMGEKMKVGDMTSPAWQKQLTDDKIKAAINDGVKREKDGVHQEMKPFKDKLTPEQVDSLVKYVRSLKK